MMQASRKRVRINVKGMVQGVGFRPAVYRYAQRKNLYGWVSNTSGGVVVEIEGDGKEVDDFVRFLKNPPLPQIEVTGLEIHLCHPQKPPDTEREDSSVLGQTLQR